MRLRVLGCHGGESPTHRATCFLVDEKFLIDAGSLTRGLSVDEQVAVDHIFVSHAHLDHVRDLGLLADNIFAKRPTPVEVYCSSSTAEGLKDNYFNNLLWPDFLTIPNPTDSSGKGMLHITEVTPGESIPIGKYMFKTVTVDHSIETQGCFLTDEKGGTLVYSGDTGPTESLWKHIAEVDNLRGFILEVSFPNSMAELAKVSGHLTPELMAAELEKFKPKNADPNMPIFLYGMKPGYHEQLKEEVKALGDERLRMLNPMDEFEL